jgi:hypothetical protein
MTTQVLMKNKIAVYVPAVCEEYVALPESAFSVFPVSLSDYLRTREMEFFIL